MYGEKTDGERNSERGREREREGERGREREREGERGREREREGERGREREREGERGREGEQSKPKKKLERDRERSMYMHRRVYISMCMIACIHTETRKSQNLQPQQQPSLRFNHAPLTSP